MRKKKKDELRETERERTVDGSEMVARQPDANPFGFREGQNGENFG